VSNAHASEFLTLSDSALPVTAPMQVKLSEAHTLLAMHTQSCFVIFRFMARGHDSLQLQSFCFILSAKIYLLLGDLVLLGYGKIK